MTGTSLDASVTDTSVWQLAFLPSAERDRRRTERHLAEAKLPAEKTLDTFAFDAVPTQHARRSLIPWHSAR